MISAWYLVIATCIHVISNSDHVLTRMFFIISYSNNDIRLTICLYEMPSRNFVLSSRNFNFRSSIFEMPSRYFELFSKNVDLQSRIFKILSRNFVLSSRN